MTDESDESGVDLSNEVAAIEAWAKENLSFEQAIHLFAVNKATADYLLDEAVREKDILIQNLGRMKELARKQDDFYKEVHAKLIESLEMEMGIPSLIVDTYKEGIKTGKAIVPKQNAKKRHAENRSMKADVFTWLNTNMVKFKSMDAAAEAVTKQQPITFRTARDWVGEWKKLRSASTP